MSKQRSLAQDTDTELHVLRHKMCVSEEVIPNDKVMHASAEHG